MKKLILAIALSCPVLLTSCAVGNPQTASVPPGPDANLTKVSIYLLDIAKATGVVQTSIIAADQAKLVSDANTTLVLNICTKINTFVSQVSVITRGQVVLPAASRAQLNTLLTPIISAFNMDMNNGLLDITDVNTKATISASLLLVQTALVGIQSIVGSN